MDQLCIFRSSHNSPNSSSKRNNSNKRSRLNNSLSSKRNSNLNSLRLPFHR